MPEGDTIHRAAATLQRALSGKEVVRFETVLPLLARVDDQTPIRGRTIEQVHAEGKHLIIDFSGGLHLRTHMRMNGSWHIYRPGERWQRPRSDMRIVLATADFVAVAFNVPVAEFHDTASLGRQEDLRRIGPDLLKESFDEQEALRRMRQRDDREIADVLLNQRVVAGIGNVFKSEVLFVSGINPFRLVGELSDLQLRTVLRNAVLQMGQNVGAAAPPSRRTVRSLDRNQLLFVYSRGGEPCRRCGTPIAYKKQGPHARGTYWCRKCQA
jgi:endonuclease-8